MTQLTLLRIAIVSINLALLSSCVPTTSPGSSTVQRMSTAHEGGEGAGGAGAGAAGGAGGAGAAGAAGQM